VTITTAQFDRKAIASVKRSDARAATLGRLIDGQYKLARRMEIAANAYTDSGQFAAQDTMRLAARQAREVIGILERTRDIAAHTSWVTQSNGKIRGLEVIK
jgi:hypothetical protein